MEEEKNRTQKEYIKRITEVLDYIEENLESELSLDILSKIARYSPFHFHRVFSTIIGESLNRYVMRKRVERIASILITGANKSLRDLAYSYGFKSESSFSRTFKKYYGISPTNFKSEGKKILSKNGIELFSTEEYIYSIDKINEWIKMNSKITIVELKKISLAGITRIGEFEKMADAYQKLMKWGHDKSVINLSNFKTITIYHDNPNITQISKVRYSVCITISKEIEASEVIRALSIQKGNYVVGSFEIKGEDISTAWKNLNIWVIENGYEFRDGDFFEIYHNDNKTHPDKKFILDICIPIKKSAKVNNEKSFDVKFSNSNEMTIQTSEDYHLRVNYMKELRAYLQKEYATEFTFGKINQSSQDYTYLSLTTEELKKIKLKFVLIFNHILNCFTICLSDQNKSIRKKYWHIFKGSDWNKFHLAESIENSLMIIDETLVEKPDFSNHRHLSREIEKEALFFINELRDILE